ncbi:hypothetical protein [Paractinoplanes ferrugineus]|uniref:hypothetical protein n=1 Tax=Paractinoplanes ferrugineus TaxID=113564 RepID=UPI001EF27D0B|nr:hypothetical protein [Actinoplanes ferrugineus]
MLYSEPPGIGPGIALNGGKILTIDKTTDGKAVTAGSPYAEEWVQRLEPCAPDALHVALVGSKDAAALWHPCVYDDPQSPVAIAGDGCVCWQTFHDPVTWMPVAANHFRTVSGNHENWRYHTCSPLGFPDGERLASLIIDGGQIWIRNQDGTLHFLPEAYGAGYGTGYGGGGPTELARMIEKIVQQDGYDITPGTASGMPDRKILAWVSSPAAKHRQELSLDQLKRLRRTGMIT